MNDSVPAVSVIIVNYNTGIHLLQCLKALVAQTFSCFEVIIVDNKSCDESISMVSSLVNRDTRVRVVRENTNRGFAAGVNLGLGCARAELVVTLNPDTVPDPDWLEELCVAAGRNPEVAMFGSIQVQPGGGGIDGTGDRYLAVGIPWRDRSMARVEAARRSGCNTYETFAPCAAAAMYRRAMLVTQGGFDSRFFCYVEDIDIAFRARLAGHRCLQVVTATVQHVGGVSSMQTAADFRIRMSMRNVVWCFLKNMPLPLLVAVLPLHLVALVVILLKAVLRGRGYIIVQAYKAALEGLPEVLCARRCIQRDRIASSLSIARAMDWNPVSYLSRA